VTVTALTTYEPVWARGKQRVAGPDEDVVTAAVAVARALPTGADEVTRVVVVTPSPDVTEGWASGVVARALDLPPHAGVELRIGDGPDVVDALVAAAPGTIVVAVDISDAAAAAAAAFVGKGQGLDLRVLAREHGSLPMRVRHVGAVQASVYDDGRVARDLFLKPLADRLRDGVEAGVAGAAPSVLARLGGTPAVTPTAGAAAAIFALRAMVHEATTGRLVVLGASGGVAVEVAAPGPVDVVDLTCAGRDAADAPRRRGAAVDIPFSMPAYARAFDAKVGLVAAECVCGEVSYPPREVCLACGRTGETHARPLARTGTIYTVVAIHVPIPGVAGPYALAIVEVDDSPVRVLAQVADVAATTPAIGDRGRLVLRRVAVREGVPDYGYAFVLDPVPAELAS
jgi:uncharacterized OB-fold protein